MPGGLPRPSILPNMRGTPWRDQVPRRAALEKAHPEVRISFLSTAWQAVVTSPAGEVVITRHELCDLLDVLDAVFAPP